MDNDPFSPTPIQESDPLRDFATDYLLQKQRASEGPAPTQPRADIEFSRSVQPPSPLMGREPKGRRPREIAPVDTGFSHPWKGSPGDGEITLAPGSIFYPFLVAGGTGDIEADAFGLVPVDYDGGTVAVSGSGYLYVIAQSGTAGTLTATQGFFTDGETLTLERGAITSITIEASSSAPSAYNPGVNCEFFPILKFSSNGQVIDRQYLTHNPTTYLTMPVVQT